MEIREISDKNIWEKFISDNSPQSLFQSWNWGEVAKKTHNLWRLGIYDNGKLSGIAQVNKVIAKRGTFLHIRHGPIFLAWDNKKFLFFISNLKELAKKEKANFVRISPLIDNSEEIRRLFRSFGFLNSPIHAIDSEYCWVIDVTKSEEQLLSEMRKTTRYLIKQAQKLGVVIVKTKDTTDLTDFFKLYRQTAERHQFVRHLGITEEFEEFLKNDKILLFKGIYQKKLLAAALVIFYNNQAIYHHSASVEQKIPVNYLMQWEIIKEAKKRGKSIYNLWGIAPENKTRHPWHGLTIFKKGFGGRNVEYLHSQDLPLSILYCTTYIIETWRRLWKGY